MKWCLAKYKTMLINQREGGMYSEEQARDLARLILENSPGLEQWLVEKVGATDFLGCLVDDLFYPGNCSDYRKRGVK